MEYLHYTLIRHIYIYIEMVHFHFHVSLPECIFIDSMDRQVTAFFWSHEFPISEAGGRNSNRHGQESTKKNGCLDMFGVLFLVRETRKKKQWIFIATMAFIYDGLAFTLFLNGFAVSISSPFSFRSSKRHWKLRSIWRFRHVGNLGEIRFHHRTATGLELTVSH